MASAIKVVHVCTFDQGGAATAALRLHAGLRKLDVDSSFLSLSQARPVANSFKFKNNKAKKLSLTDRVKKKLGQPLTRAEKNNELIAGITGKFETFSFPQTDFRVEDDPHIQSADIINLHWISFFVNYPSFFRSISKPIVWTFHDMNPFMGGFHYRGDLDRNPNFGEIDTALRKIKRDALSANNNLTVVTPSQWLGDSSRESDVMKSRTHHYIPYGLDTTVFKPHNREFSANVFNLPTDKKIILFVTERIDNYRKGFDLLMDAVSKVDLKDDYVIVTIGENSPELSKYPNLISLGRINDDHLLSILYSSADLFVLPSREDNLPNVMLESLACGTPILSFATGGMKEIIRHGFNGILAPLISSDSLRDALRNFVDGKFLFDRHAIREDAVNRFALSVQANAYKELYSRLISGE